MGGIRERVESNHDTPPLPRNFPPFSLHALPQCEPKHLLHPISRLRGALDVFGTDFACDLRALVGSDRRLALCAKHPSCIVVPAKIRLGRDEYERRALTEVRYFGVPLNAGQRPPFDIRHGCLQGGMKGSGARTLSRTFARLTGKSTEKTMRMTWLSG
jgi:hypothetical protein